MRYTLGSCFSIGLIQLGTIVRTVKLDAASVVKPRRNEKRRERERENK